MLMIAWSSWTFCCHCLLGLPLILNAAASTELIGIIPWLGSNKWSFPDHTFLHAFKTVDLQHQNFLCSKSHVKGNTLMPIAHGKHVHMIIQMMNYNVHTAKKINRNNWSVFWLIKY